MQRSHRIEPVFIFLPDAFRSVLSPTLPCRRPLEARTQLATTQVCIGTDSRPLRSQEAAPLRLAEAVQPAVPSVRARPAPPARNDALTARAWPVAPARCRTWPQLALDAAVAAAHGPAGGGFACWFGR